MSVEVLKGDDIYEKGDKTDKSVGPWFHDAVHDMESLFWVLMFICLTRKGPGANMYRDQLLEQDNNNLKTLIRGLFDDKEMLVILMNKQAHFFRPDKLESEVMANFDGYFQDLKKMMFQWWRILILAYKYRKFEYWTIHDQIIDILDRAIKDLPREKCDDNDEKAKNEVKRREQVRNYRLKDFKVKNKVELGSKIEPEFLEESFETSPDRPRPSTRNWGHPPYSDDEPGSPTPTRVQKKQRL